MKKIIVSIIITGLLLGVSSLSAGLDKTMAYEQDGVVETFSSGFLEKQYKYQINSKSIDFSEKACYIHGSINGPFICLRIPGLIYYIVSNVGGEIYVECPDYTIYQPGDFFKMIIIGWTGIFMPPLHNGYNLMSREFEGYADIVNFEVY